MAPSNNYFFGILSEDLLKQTVNKIASEENAFILFDFDGFSKIKDTFGSEKSKEILEIVLKKIRLSLKKTDIIGHIETDCFMICVQGVSSLASIERIAKHIVLLCRNTMSNGILLSAGVGVARSPSNGSNYQEIFEKCSKAISEAKRRGGDCFVIYDDIENSEKNIKRQNSNDEYDSERIARSYNHNMLIIYDCISKKYDYSFFVKEQFDADFDTRPLWQIMKDDGILSEKQSLKFKNKIEEFEKLKEPHAHYTEFYIKNTEQIWKWYRVGFICYVSESKIIISFTDISDEIGFHRRLSRMTEYDELTGLQKRSLFCHTVEELLTANQEIKNKSGFAIIFIDIIKFKAINEILGNSEGDRILIYMSDLLNEYTKDFGAASRLGSDSFALFIKADKSDTEDIVNSILRKFSSYIVSFEITCNAGIYLTTEENISVDSMIDRASLAQSTIKGNYSQKYIFYTEEMRNQMLSEQEISGIMATALNENQFDVYYQPQYNHSTGMLVGSEALVRWNHPEKGLISPGLFIPLFEKNGFITRLDLYVFEKVCIFLRKIMDENFAVVPISTNFSRYDIFKADYIESIEKIRQKYDIPSKYIRVEITESATVGGSIYVNEIIKKLHNCGYIVEMDDFGSGYSSLNVLKDVDFDIVKLDMKFLSSESDNNRGGTILSSIVRMTQWLNMPVIAEGVENIAQADFLNSIGCNYIQGYLYSKPLPEEKYLSLLNGSYVGATVPQMKLIEKINSGDFWNPVSQETLIFSNYVGGAAIFEYSDNEIQIQRVNKKYLQEIGMNLSENDVINSNFFDFFDEKNKKIYIATINNAISSLEEQECETWRKITSECCGNEELCIRSTIKIIGISKNRYLFYAMIRNITTERKYIDSLLKSKDTMHNLYEQADIFSWEYIISTKEMKPCFRCMKELGLPPLLRNYPEPVIERGIFPPDYAELYRDWHKQLEKGVKYIEGIIPLTEKRIPYVVRYTTEFDENGKPVKAFGSATKVVENK